ncbi:MAG TPA: MASE4 domain-containing protein [Phenylobacterium sp.]
MSKDYLGLFDTPPDRLQVRFAAIVVGVLVAACLAILPFRAVPVPEVDAFIPAVTSIVFLGELITAVLLYAQASVFRSRSLNILASGYICTALLLIPYTLSFPGVIEADGWLGAGPNTTAWIAMPRKWIFSIAILLFVLSRKADSETETLSAPSKALPYMLGAIGLAMAVTLFATLGQQALPDIFSNREDVFRDRLIAAEAVAFALSLVAAASLYRTRRSVLDLWLLVALAAWMLMSLLNMGLTARFTAGWYWLQMVMLFSHLVVMLALVAEANRLYARLALETAARQREREARQMSIDATAFAISEEVGQPLTAAKITTAAGLKWLSRPEPDVEAAIRSLQVAIDAGRQVTDVVKGVRAVLAERSGEVTEFDLNELVCEVTGSLHREIAAGRTSLSLVLDDSLPLVRADRVQIQRVMVNLLIRAIQSVNAIRGRRRSIVIQSGVVDSSDILIEIIDNGVGVTAEELESIFAPFYENRSVGMGLDLSLCRMIVDRHGGVLWVTPGEPRGARFHLRLPRSLPVTDQDGEATASLRAALKAGASTVPT